MGPHRERFVPFHFYYMVPDVETHDIFVDTPFRNT